MADAIVRIPAEARDVLARVAAAEGLSLRAYLTRLADSLAPPAEWVEHAANAREVLKRWNGYDPSEAEAALIDAELDRRIAKATG